jgi:hypothetical protein
MVPRKKAQEGVDPPLKGNQKRAETVDSGSKTLETKRGGESRLRSAHAGKAKATTGNVMRGGERRRRRASL